AEGNLNKAISTLNKLINEFPSSTYVPKAYLKLGLSYFNMQQEEKALKAYKDVVLKFPKTDEAQEALLALKELYVYLGRPDDYLDFVQNQAGINLSTTEQDQLMFESAENQYINGNCTDAITSLTKYIDKFPKGNDILNAHYFRADCLFKGNDFQNAYFDYIRINEFGANKYQEEALLKATYIAYEKNKDYAGALSLYEQLYKVATMQSNQEIALIGMLRSNYKLKNYTKVLEDADKVLSNNSINTDVKTEATFYKAKAHFELQQYNLAKSGFEQIVNTVSNSAIKAESAYSLAFILNKNAQYEQSNTACFKIKDEYASYEYWVVKTFILIADNYQALDNIFQAKATLQSIVDNYKGDETLLNEAKAKLEKLKQLEIENSKLDLNPQEQDTIQFDNK
ncbi:MAG: tetratricopeptide repeat protein, partial [Bacteroidetes bacterium]|nr:tetratricopeptide repeat protein [Bacteroidota bacterium]